MQQLKQSKMKKLLAMIFLPRSTRGEKVVYPKTPAIAKTVVTERLPYNQWNIDINKQLN
jgi:hypothetical protein